MKKYPTYFFLAILVQFLATDADAQGKGFLERKVSNYLDQTPFNKVVVFFNKERFLPGDTAWINAQVLGADLKLFSRRQILNIELVDVTGKIVHRQFILITTGQAASYLAIPENIPDGLYLVRAYTDWMKNFGETCFFYKEIEIVGDYSRQKVSPSPSIELFAEGGHLISNVLNHLVIRYSDVPLGSVISIRGSSGLSFGSIYTDESGLGSIKVIPELNDVITAVHANGTVSKPLQAEQNGISVIFRKNNDQTHAVLYVPSNSPTRRINVNVLVLGRGKIIREFFTVFKEDSLEITLQTRNWEDGLYQFYLLDDEQNVLCRRIWNINNYSITSEIFINNKTPGSRSPVTVELTLKDADGNPLEGTFSATVTNDQALITKGSISENELIEKYYSSFVDNNPKNLFSEEKFDLHLITKKENWLLDRFSSAAFQPPNSFRNVLFFKGSIQRPNGLSVRDSSQVVFFLQKEMLGYEVAVIQNRFEFPVLFDFKGNDDLFYCVHTGDSLLTDAKMILDRDTISGVKPALSKIQFSKDLFSDFGKKIRATEKSFRFFTTSGPIKEGEEIDPNAEFEDELMGADVSVKIDDYVVFPTLVDVIREIIPSLKHRKLANREIVRVFLYSPVLINDPILSTGDPLYIIDGVMTKSTAYFMSLNPADLISIKIVKNIHKLKHLGFLGKNGVVLVNTKKPGAIRSFQNTMIPVQGLNKSWSANYETTHLERVPDLRLTLFWAPSKTTGSDGRSEITFTTGDNLGRYQVRIEGITRTGEPFCAVEFIEVTAR